MINLFFYIIKIILFPLFFLSGGGLKFSDYSDMFDLRTDEIIDRFMSSTLFKQIEYTGSCFETILYEAFLEKQPLVNMILFEKRLETDIIISQKIMYYIREFFYLYSRKIKTRKVFQKIGRFTRKKL